MRLRHPRIAPMPAAEWDAETSEYFSRIARGGKVFNIFTTLARHPALLRRWTVFASHILGKSTLPVRERELAILRVGWLCRAGYEWGHHVEIGKESGLTAEEIQRVTKGPDAAGWDRFEATLLRGVDELHADSFLSDTTWRGLAERFNTQQMLDFIFTVGQYNLVCMVLNSVGVQLEEGYERIPDSK